MPKKVYIDGKEFDALLKAATTLDESLLVPEAMLGIDKGDRIETSRQLRRLISKYINA